MARRLEKHEARTDVRTPEEPPRDIDEFRNAMARRIARFIANRKGYWRSCREPVCRRQRSCCAPYIHCSNAPPRTPDPDGTRSARAVAQFLRVLKAVQEQRAAEEAQRAERDAQCGDEAHALRSSPRKRGPSA